VSLLRPQMGPFCLRLEALPSMLDLRNVATATSCTDRTAVCVGPGIASRDPRGDLGVRRRTPTAMDGSERNPRVRKRVKRKRVIVRLRRNGPRMDKSVSAPGPIVGRIHVK
jgi:hypothetical protein